MLEVFTPPLSHAANTDPQVESLVVGPTSASDQQRYLHTSPEFAMKRLLCAYPETDLYQLATVFRAEEHGRYHLSQFTMLEWYRIGMDHRQLMRDVAALFKHVWQTFELAVLPVATRSYCQEVNARLGCWPDKLSGAQVREYFIEHERSFPRALENDLAASLDLFMDEFVVPEFDENSITFLSDYPASQAALARVGSDVNGNPVAERFEVFVGRIELANGFHELNNASIQRIRFKNDLQRRQQRSQARLPIDENLLAALDNGLPDCAGVALGVERLLMVLGHYSHINQVAAFSDAHA